MKNQVIYNRKSLASHALLKMLATFMMLMLFGGSAWGWEMGFCGKGDGTKMWNVQLKTDAGYSYLPNIKGYDMTNTNYAIFDGNDPVYADHFAPTAYGQYLYVTGFWTNTYVANNQNTSDSWINTNCVQIVYKAEHEGVERNFWSSNCSRGDGDRGFSISELVIDDQKMQLSDKSKFPVGLNKMYVRFVLQGYDNNNTEHTVNPKWNYFTFTVPGIKVDPANDTKDFGRVTAEENESEDNESEEHRQELAFETWGFNDETKRGDITVTFTDNSFKVAKDDNGNELISYKQDDNTDLADKGKGWISIMVDYLPDATASLTTQTHTAEVTVSVQYNGLGTGMQTYTNSDEFTVTGQCEPDLSQSDIIPVIAKDAQVHPSLTGATLYGYLLEYGCHNDIKEYGIYYWTGGDGTSMPDNATSVKSPKTTAIKAGDSWDVTLEGLMSNTTYYYKTYAKSTLAGFGVSAETGSFTTSCTPVAIGDTVYIDVDKTFANDDQCLRQFTTITAAIDYLRNKDNNLVKGSDPQERCDLLTNVVIRIAQGNYTDETPVKNKSCKYLDLDGINGYKSDDSNADDTADGKGYRLILRTADAGLRPIVGPIHMRRSRNITINHLAIDGKALSAVEGGNSSYQSVILAGILLDADTKYGDFNMLKVGKIANANLEFINTKIESKGFAGIEIAGVDGIKFENCVIDTHVDDDDDDGGFSKDAQDWGASVKMVNCKNVVFVRNSITGSHTSSFFMQHVQQMLFMNNVVWNDNTTPGDVAIMRFVMFNGGNSHAIQNIGMYYNTFYLANAADNDDDETDSYKTDFVCFGGDAQTGKEDYYKANLIDFRYNNCYSYDDKHNGGTSSDQFQGKDDELSGFDSNNFWSEYDQLQYNKLTSEAEKENYKSVLAFGSNPYFLNVKDQLCEFGNNEPSNLVMKGYGLNVGASITFDASTLNLAQGMFCDRRFPSNGADAVRPRGNAALNNPGNDVPYIELSVSSNQTSSSFDVDVHMTGFTANQSVTFKIDGKEGASYFACPTAYQDRATIAADGTYRNIVRIEFDYKANEYKTQEFPVELLVKVDGGVKQRIPVVGKVYEMGAPVKTGWTLGAYQYAENNIVDKIYWQGDSKGRTGDFAEWDDRSNWLKEDGSMLTCSDIIAKDVKVIIPAPENGKGGTITRYPKFPEVFMDDASVDANDDDKIDDEEKKTMKRYRKGVPGTTYHPNEHVDAGAGYVGFTTELFCDTIHLEHGAWLSGVENLAKDGVARYQAVKTTFEVVDRTDWVLVGPMVKTFEGDGSVRDFPISGDFYLGDTPAVYMREVEIKDGKYSWTRSFPDMDTELSTQRAFAVYVPDAYGPYRIPSRYYYGETSPMADAGSKPITYQIEGRFINESAMPKYTNLKAGTNHVLVNTYPCNFSIDELAKLGTVQMYEYDGTCSFSNVETGEINPQQSFLFSPAEGSELQITESMLAVGNTHYAKGLFKEKPYIRVQVKDPANGYGSNVLIHYDEDKVIAEENLATDAPKAFNNANMTVPELYIMMYGKQYAGLDIESMDKTIPLGLRLNKSGNKALRTIEFNNIESKNFTSAVLLDKETGEEYDLMAGESIVIADVPVSSAIEGRFFINLEVSPEDEDASDDDVATEVEEGSIEGGDIFIYEQNGYAVVSSVNGVELQTVYITDMAGHTVEYKAAGDYGKFRIPFEQGVCVVRAVGDTQSKTAKIIKE